MPNITGRVLSRPTEMTKVFGFRCKAGRKNRSLFSVPIIGKVYCHKKIGPSLKEVLTDVENDGKADLIWLDDYRNSGGCYNCRLTKGSTSWSPHAWAVAIDINPHEGSNGERMSRTNFKLRGPNPPRLRVLAEYFADWGWSWGGMWRRRDPMHFEATDVTLEVYRQRRTTGEFRVPAVLVGPKQMPDQAVMWSSNREKLLIDTHVLARVWPSDWPPLKLQPDGSRWQHIRAAVAPTGRTVIWDADSWRAIIA